MAHVVGAGCAPAYLNWDEAPALEPIRGKIGWREVGVFEPVD